MEASPHKAIHPLHTSPPAYLPFSRSTLRCPHPLNKKARETRYSLLVAQKAKKRRRKKLRLFVVRFRKNKKNGDNWNRKQHFVRSKPTSRERERGVFFFFFFFFCTFSDPHVYTFFSYKSTTIGRLTGLYLPFIMQGVTESVPPESRCVPYDLWMCPPTCRRGRARFIASTSCVHPTAL